MDLFGNFPAATVVTTAPTYTASSATFGGRACATYLHATEQRLDLVSFSINQPDTIYVVASNTNTATSNTLIDGSVTRQDIGLSVANAIQFYAGGSVLTGAGSFAGGAGHVLCAQFNGGTSQLYLDNSQAFNVSGNPGTGALSGLYIGNTGASFAITGGIAEILIVPGQHSFTQIKAYFDYVNLYYTLPGVG